MGGKSAGDRRVNLSTGQQLPPGTMPGVAGAATGASAPGSNMMTLPGAMPGQLEAISQQLGGAFGMPQQDILAQLQQLHKPMQVQDPSKPWAAPGGGGTPNPNAGWTPAGTVGGNQVLQHGSLYKMTKNGRDYRSDNGISGWTPM